MKRVFFSLALILASAASGHAQWYNVTFRGQAYGRDGSGNLVPTPLTEQTLIQVAAQARSIPTNNLALIYHVESGGDSIKVVNKTTGDQYVRFFLFTFGQSLGRSGVTNSVGDESRVLEYAYTTDSTALSSWNDHSMGSVVLTKRLLTDGSGNTKYVVDGQNLSWCVLPQGNESAKTCIGTFQTGTLFTLQ